jgi:hypothetical protein
MRRVRLIDRSLAVSSELLHWTPLISPSRDWRFRGLISDALPDSGCLWITFTDRSYTQDIACGFAFDGLKYTMLLPVRQID